MGDLMGNKVIVNGTVYSVMGGKCKIDGTDYIIDHGVTTVDGTSRIVEIIQGEPGTIIFSDVDFYGMYRNNIIVFLNNTEIIASPNSTFTEDPVKGKVGLKLSIKAFSSTINAALIVNGSTVVRKTIYPRGTSNIEFDISGKTYLLESEFVNMSRNVYFTFYLTEKDNMYD